MGEQVAARLLYGSYGINNGNALIVCRIHGHAAPWGSPVSRGGLRRYFITNTLPDAAEPGSAGRSYPAHWLHNRDLITVPAHHNADPPLTMA